MTGKNRLVPIDHSDILTGPCWSFEDLIQHEDAWTLNKLIDIIWPVELLPLPIRSAILKSADRFQSAYAAAREDLYLWLAACRTIGLPLPDML